MEHKLTIEQEKYINYADNTNTILFACAGSVKTKCIINKINASLKNNVYKTENILMLTFSRFTKDDFLNRIKKFPDNLIEEKQVRTIDSFAKKLIDPNNEIDVSLLSYRFMKYLENTTKKELVKNSNLTNIKSLYIDEAQDLNEIQYKTFILLNSKLDILLNFVADPNQNIYPFRGSSEKFIMGFDINIKKFYLTTNFRSYKSIIEFSKYLRPYPDTDIICSLGDNNVKPLFFFHKNDKQLEESLIAILNQAQQNNIDFSDIAILSPTRGRMRNYGKSHGLCFISNILYKAGIKFKQFYEESTNYDQNNNILYKPKKGCVNIMTYMGSKGLEWKYVILIDANMCLINKKNFNEIKHSHDQYLLYVASSRAIENLIIFSEYNDNFKFNLNSWFSFVPKDNYIIDPNIKNQFNFQSNIIKPYDIKVKTETNICKIIDNLTDEELDKFASICYFGNGITNKYSPKKNITNIYKNNDINNAESTMNVFLNKYIKNLFNALFCIKNKIDKYRYYDIENIINNSIHKLINVPPNITEWFYNNKNIITWEEFEINKQNIDIKIVEYIEANFDKNVDIKQHTIINDNSVAKILFDNIEHIKINYENYIKCTNNVEIRKYIFNITNLLYSMETQHYFHILNNGKKFKNILIIYKDLFDNIDNYVNTTSDKFIKFNILINKWGLNGEINIIEKNNIIWELKTTDISLKHILQVLMLNIMNNYETYKKNNIIKLNFINILKGEKISYIFKFSLDKINTIKDVFIDKGI